MSATDPENLTCLAVQNLIFENGRHFKVQNSKSEKRAYYVWHSHLLTNWRTTARNI